MISATERLAPGQYVFDGLRLSGPGLPLRKVQAKVSSFDHEKEFFRGPDSRNGCERFPIEQLFGRNQTRR